MYISKKDLLAMTGISYGQLYRWKRERLIPEEWFIKQSSFTGQETFFPREQILSRIRSILELKDKYSLEELARMLSPEVVQGMYYKSDLLEIHEINTILIPIFMEIANKEDFCYTDIILMIIITEIKESLNLSVEELRDILSSILIGIRQITSKEITIGILEFQKVYLPYVISTNSDFYLDEQAKFVYKRNYLDVSNHIKIKYQQKFRDSVK